MRSETSFVHTPEKILIGTGSTTLLASDPSSLLESTCAQVVAGSFRTGKVPAADDLGGVRRASETLARAGTVLRDAQRIMHAAVSHGLKRHVAGSEPSVVVVDRAVFMMKVLEVLGNVISGAYLDLCRRDPEQIRERVTHVVDLLCADDPEARGVAERSGIELATEYHVVVLHFVDASAGTGTSSTRRLDAEVVDAAASSGATQPGMLMSLVPDGGLLLLPATESPDIESPDIEFPDTEFPDIDGAVAKLSSALGVDIVAATSRASVGDVAAVVAHCRELVRLARCLDMECAVYRTGDLALEYQLSRPGPGRSRLRSVIAPLDGYPELVHTLRTFIGSEANRRASAKSLFVHPNTVDYRLKRIEQLTGVDPLSSVGLMSLHAALVVDALARANSRYSAPVGAVAAAS